jgi:hypothetical protein
MNRQLNIVVHDNQIGQRKKKLIAESTEIFSQNRGVIQRPMRLKKIVYYTGNDFTVVLKQHQIRIGMDGRAHGLKL